MAATKKSPSTKSVPITTDTIVLPFATGPIPEIMESVSTESVAIDITNSAIQEVLPSNEIELGVLAPDKKAIERVLGQVIGGQGFLYALRERRGFEGYFDLWITSFIGPLYPDMFARALQGINRRVTFLVDNHPVPAL